MTDDAQPAAAATLRLPAALRAQTLRVCKGAGQPWSAISVVSGACATLREIRVDHPSPEFFTFLTTIDAKLTALETLDVVVCPASCCLLQQCRFPVLETLRLRLSDDVIERHMGLITAEAFGCVAPRLEVRTPLPETEIARIVVGAVQCAGSMLRVLDLCADRASKPWQKLGAECVQSDLEVLRVDGVEMLNAPRLAVAGFSVVDPVVPRLRPETLEEWRTADGGRGIPITLMFVKDFVECLMDPNAFLNDSIVDAFVDRAARNSTRPVCDTEYCAVADFARPDLRRPDHMQSLHGARLARARRVPTKRFLLAPACVRKHFVLIIVDCVLGVVRSYDSVRGSSCVRPSAVEAEAYAALDVSVRRAAPRLEPQVTPVQRDGVSCGVIVCELVRRWALGMRMARDVDVADMRVVMAQQFVVEMHDAVAAGHAVRTRAEELTAVRALMRAERADVPAYRTKLNAYWAVAAGAGAPSSKAKRERLSHAAASTAASEA